MRKALGTLLLLLVVPASCAEAPPLAIRNARLVTVGGPVIEHGTVHVRDGLIEAVGAEVSLPSSAWVIDGSGLTVYPGLIDALSNWGIPQAAPPMAASPPSSRSAPPSTPSQPPARGPEDRPSNTSWIRAADQVRPDERRLEAARSAGFTSAVTFPTQGIFAGQGAVINLAGERTGEMIITPSAGLYLSLARSGGFGFPGSLMGAMAYIHQVCLDADHYKQATELYARNPRGTRRPDYDRALEGLLESPRILLPGTRAVEIDRMIRFAARLNRSAVLYGGHEGYRVVSLLKQSGTPLLVSLRWPEKSRDADPEQEESLRTLEMREKAPSTPAELAKAGVRWAFYGGGIEKPEDAVKAVKRAIDAGLSHADAVRAMTLGAADIYGVADRLGSIEAGKIANLLITRGELFQEKTKVEFVLIDGVKYAPVAAEPAGEASK